MSAKPPEAQATPEARAADIVKAHPPEAQGAAADFVTAHPRTHAAAMRLQAVKVGDDEVACTSGARVPSACE